MPIVNADNADRLPDWRGISALNRRHPLLARLGRDAEHGSADYPISRPGTLYHDPNLVANGLPLCWAANPAPVNV